MKKTAKTFPKFTDSYGRVLTEENIKTLYNYAQYHRYDLKTDNRINHCQAYYSDMVFVEIEAIEDLSTEHKKEKYYVKAYFIKSYSTFVAVYLPEFDVVISFGRYSMTTYQHISKYVKNYTPSYTQTYNTEYVNWF